MKRSLFAGLFVFLLIQSGVDLTVAAIPSPISVDSK